MPLGLAEWDGLSEGEMLMEIEAEEEVDGDRLRDSLGDSDSLGEVLGDSLPLGETDAEAEPDGLTDGDSLVLGLWESDALPLGLIEADTELEGEALELGDWDGLVLGDGD